MSSSIGLTPYFEYLDQIISIELKNRPAQQGGTERRYRLARQQQGDRALTDIISEALHKRAIGGTAILTTGTGNPVWLPEGETDGPSGVAILARAFSELGIRSCILSEERFLPGIRASVQSAGTPVLTEASWAKRSNGAICLAVPTGAVPGGEFIEKLLASRDDWSVAMFVEKPGPGQEGRFHNSSGKEKDADWVAHLHLLAQAARSRGLLTIGIGDGGNEIGFARIREALHAAEPHRYGCDCGCVGGLLDDTEVDFLLPASVSNWGAYALVAALALRLGRSSLMPDWKQVEASIKAPLEHGAFDGYTGLSLPTCDGVSVRGNQSVYHLLEEVVDLAFAARTASGSQ